MRLISIALVLLPYFAFSQQTPGDYAIYSQYLKVFQSSKKVEKMYFVVKDLGDSVEYQDEGVIGTVKDLTLYLKGDKSVTFSDVYFTFRDILSTLKKDSLWIPVIDELSAKIKQKFEIENKFSPDLHTIIISEDTYHLYFRNFNHIEKSWEHFHKHYPLPSALISLSKIAGDGTRTVFYFSERCGGLCGDGELVFFQKENGKWKFLAKSALWYN